MRELGVRRVMSGGESGGREVEVCLCKINN